MCYEFSICQQARLTNIVTVVAPRPVEIAKHVSMMQKTKETTTAAANLQSPELEKHAHFTAHH